MRSNQERRRINPPTKPTASNAAPGTPVAASAVAPPPPALYADAGSDRTVIAGADVEFDASAYDENQQILDSSAVRFMWNFGDGGTAEGQAVLHHFTYPGRYDVVLTIAHNKAATADDVIVTAEPAALGFSLLPDGGVAIENRAGHDLDLSDWIVKESASVYSAQFMLPDYSKILAGASMNISAQTLQFHASSSTILEYPNGTTAFFMGQESGTSTQPVQEMQKAAPALQGAGAAPVSTVQRVRTIAAPEVSAPGDTSAAPESAATATVIQTAAAGSAPGSKYLWWLGVFALAGAAACAIAAAAYFKKGEWDIVEESE